MPTPKKPGGNLPLPSNSKKMIPIKKKKLMGTTADQRGASGKLKGWDYGKGGAWKNPSGTQVGHSYQEDSTITPMKSTGDTASPLSNAVHIHLYGDRQPLNTQKAAKLKNQLKGKGGY